MYRLSLWALLFAILSLLFFTLLVFLRIPLSALFFVACLVSFLLHVGWGVCWRGFPEFIEVGIF